MNYIKMYYQSKTQSFDQQNQNPNDFFDHPTIAQGVLASDFALSKALDNISELQQNLIYMINLNSQLEQQNSKLKSSYQKLNQYVKQDRQNLLNQCKKKEKQTQQIVEVLEETKQALLCKQIQVQQSKLEIQKCNRKIFQQKRAIEDLQQNYMNQSLSYAMDSSINIGKNDLQCLAQLQRQKNELIIELKRKQKVIEKNETRMAKIQKQNLQFKKWLANVLGLTKVVQGSQKILMKQISQRILP